MTKVTSLTTATAVAERIIAACTVSNGGLSPGLRAADASKSSYDTVSGVVTQKRHDFAAELRFGVNHTDTLGVTAVTFDSVDDQYDVAQILQLLDSGGDTTLGLTKQLRELMLRMQYLVLAYLVYNRLRQE